MVVVHGEINYDDTLREKKTLRGLARSACAQDQSSARHRPRLQPEQQNKWLVFGDPKIMNIYIILIVKTVRFKKIS